MMLAGLISRWTTPLSWGGGEAARDLRGDTDGAIDGQRPLGDLVIEARTFDQRHRDEGRALGFVDLKDGTDVGVVQSRGGLRLANETGPDLLIAPAGAPARI